MRGVYLLLAVLGAVVPYLSFVPWLLENGFNLPLLWHEITASRLSGFAWLDVLLSVLTILVFAGAESRRTHMPFPLLSVLACFLIGASYGLPLFMYQRERFLNRA